MFGCLKRFGSNEDLAKVVSLVRQVHSHLLSIGAPVSAETILFDEGSPQLVDALAAMAQKRRSKVFLLNAKSPGVIVVLH